MVLERNRAHEYNQSVRASVQLLQRLRYQPNFNITLGCAPSNLQVTPQDIMQPCIMVIRNSRVKLGGRMNDISAHHYFKFSYKLTFHRWINFISKIALPSL